MSVKSAQRYVFDPSADRFAILSADNRVSVWDTSSGELRVQCYETKHLSSDYTCCAWGSDAKIKSGKKNKESTELIAVGTTKGTIVVWDVRTGETVCLLGTKGEGHTGKVNDIVFGSAGVALYSCGEDGTVIQWDMRAYSKITQWKDKSPIQRLAINPSGSILATGGTAIKLWDMSSHKPLHKFTGHSTIITKLVFSPDGKYLFSIAAERSIHMWDCNIASESENAVKTFTCESTPLALEVNTKQVAPKDSAYHILALTEAGSINIWAYRSSEKSKQKQENKFMKPNGTVHADKSKGIIAVQFAGVELLVACRPEAGPSFRRVKYLDTEKEEILVSIALGQKQAVAASASKKAKTSATVVAASEMPVTDVPAEALKQATSQHADQLKDIEKKSKAQAGKNSAYSFHSTLQQAIHTGDKQLLTQCLKTQHQGAFSATLSKLEPKFVVPLMRILVSMLKSSAHSPVLFSHLSTLIQRNTALLLASGALPECTSLHSTLDARLSYFKELSKLQGRLGLLLDHIKQNDQVVEVDPTPKSVYKDRQENGDVKMEDVVNSEASDSGDESESGASGDESEENTEKGHDDENSASGDELENTSPKNASSRKPKLDSAQDDQGKASARKSVKHKK